MKSINVGLAGTAVVAALASPILAVTSALSAPPQPSTLQQSGDLSSSVLLAELRNYCNEDESLFASIETRGYWVNICGGDLPHTYVGVSKRNGKSIRVPLADYDDDGSYFEAINGDISYLLVRDTPRGSFLTVTQGDQELMRQVVLDWE